jgi:phosphoribulokinase
MVFLVGIAGDSASGKTTFAQGIVRLFGEKNVKTLSLDNYHLYNREERRRLNLTPLNPAANDFVKIQEDIEKLKNGEDIIMPVYSHETGDFESPVVFKPGKIVIVEGLHPFYKKTISDLFDLRVFIDPEYDVRREWKIKRDVEKRGYRIEDVIKEMELRKVDYKKYIEKQKRRAEIIVKIRKDRKVESCRMGSSYWIKILQEASGERLSSVRIPIDLSSMCELEADEFYFEYRKIKRGKRVFSQIEFNGTLSREAVSELENSISKISGGGKVFEGDVINETDIARFIIGWRVAERYRKFMRKFMNMGS